MKRKDLWMQTWTMMAYIMISPILFDTLYPTTGDPSLIWIWVVVVTGSTALISLFLIIFLNLIVAPAKTYKIKGIIPFGISTFLMHQLGETNDETKTAFLICNMIILIVLYLMYIVVFSKRLD